MVARERQYMPGINHYVPNMQFSASGVHDKPVAFSLGTPAVASATALDTDIDADAVAGTETSQSWTADSPYGRTLTMSADVEEWRAHVESSLRAGARVTTADRDAASPSGSQAPRPGASWRRI